MNTTPTASKAAPTVPAARSRPFSDEHAPYYGKYVMLVSEGNVLDVLTSQVDDEISFLRGVPEGSATVLHAPYTWTIKQVVGHLTDGERVFGYRALRFARGDATPLPGFEENDYALAVEHKTSSLKTLVSEFEAVRRATIALLAGLSDDSWLRRGQANGQPVSVRALAYIIAGHTRHHMKIVRARLDQG